MDAQNPNTNQELKTVLEYLQRLEKRVARIEAYLDLEPIYERDKKSKTTISETSLEFQIGEFWLARVGAVILLMGIAFFISYPFPTIPPLLASLFGYAAVATQFGLSHYWRKASPHLSRLLYGGSFVLLYFATLRLHFFSKHPAIASEAVGLSALLIVLIFNLFVAARRKSEILAFINLFLCYCTSLFSINAQFTLILITLSSMTAIFLLIKFNWHTVAILALIMAYTSHALWLLNNPIIGNTIQAISTPHFNLLYLVIYGSGFALTNLLRKSDTYGDFFEIMLSIFNGFGFFAIGALNIIMFFKAQLGLLGILTSGLFLSFAVLNWKHVQRNYATAYYSCFAYVALSVAIFAQFKYPSYFVWLSLESMLVIITALWFRSRVIIVTNIFIYLGIFIAYLVLAKSNDYVSASYAITALASARILNWKKDRLELKTDMIRNTYLACAFIIVLYGLFHAVPSSLVTISWLAAALFYIGLSLLLRNIKYRWMAILTIFAAVIHVFIIDISRLNAGYRIILFLAVGIVILLLSLFYTKFRKKLLGSK